MLYVLLYQDTSLQLYADQAYVLQCIGYHNWTADLFASGGLTYMFSMLDSIK